MNEQREHPYLQQAIIDLYTYLPKDKGPMAKDASNYRIWDEIDIKRMGKWPWYAKYLLPFIKPKISWDSTEHVTCAIYAKKLFGRTYITKTKMEKVKS